MINEVSLDDEVSSEALPLTVRTKADHHLRRLTLFGLFGLITLSLVLLTAGSAFGWFQERVSDALLQVVVAPGIGALTVIIGYLFGERRS